MPYAEGRVYHDADSHLMEAPDWLIQFADPAVRDRLEPLWMQGLADYASETITKVNAGRGDPTQLKSAEEKLMTRKNWTALGAVFKEDRSHALDLLGFSSQLVFSTYGSGVLLDHPAKPPGSVASDKELLYAAVTAHNRGVTDFCSDDPRLLPVGWVPQDVPELAIKATREALDLGCAAIEIPSYPVGPQSLSHLDLHPMYEMLESAGRPLVFHVGGGGRLASRVFLENGLPYPRDFHGGEENLRAMDFMGIPAPVELALSALIFDGVLEKFPGLMVGVIEQGATWVPSFMRRLDQALRAFGKNEERLAALPIKPSEYLLRQMRFTPFPFEPVDWVIENSSPDIVLFSSDYPHVEGGRNPLKNFSDSLEGESETILEHFYKSNFEDLMGPVLKEAGLARAG